MKHSELTPEDVLFTHFDDRTGVQTTYAVSRLITFCKESKHERFLVPATEPDAQYILKNRGIEQPRLDRLAALAFNRFEPVIFCAQDGGSSWLLVDGSHRYVEAVRRKETLIEAYMLSEAEWAPFVIEDLPAFDAERMMQRPSGL